MRIARWCVAKAQRHLGKVEEALTAQMAILKQIEESGAEPDGFVFEEIAECLLAQGHSDEARSFCRRAHDCLSSDPYLVANESERLERLRRLGSE